MKRLTLVFAMTLVCNLGFSDWNWGQTVTSIGVWRNFQLRELVFFTVSGRSEVFCFDLEGNFGNALYSLLLTSQVSGAKIDFFATDEKVIVYSEMGAYQIGGLQQSLGQ